MNCKEHTFGVSGKLIMNALVMYGHQSRTLWSQFLGKGVKGQLTETSLDFVSVKHTTWSAWLDTHPDTLVLDKNDGYYYRGTDAGVIGATRSDNRLHRKAMIGGGDFDEQTKAYPFEETLGNPVVNDTFGGEDIVVFFEQATNTALVFGTDRR